MENSIQRAIEAIEETTRKMIDTIAHMANISRGDIAKSNNEGQATKLNNRYTLIGQRTIIVGMLLSIALIIGGIAGFGKYILILGVVGLALFAWQIIRRHKKSSSPIVVEDHYKISTIKKLVTQNVMTAIDQVNEMWITATNDNKALLLKYIESLDINGNDRFNASCILLTIKVPDFELIKIRNFIDMAESTTELHNSIEEVCNSICKEINSVSKYQLDKYRQVNDILNK